MQISVLRCPNCGAPVQLEANCNALTCEYCLSIIAVSVNYNAAIANNNSAGNSDYLLRKVQPELKYPANYKASFFNAQGGFLWINKDEVLFSPHSFNFGDLRDRYIRIQDVAGYSKGFLTNFSIWTMNGKEMKLVVWKKDEIIREIERRRRFYYTNAGLPVPELKYGNVKI